MAGGKPQQTMGLSSRPGESVIRSMVDRLEPWFHNLHLPDGTQTAPDHFLGDFPAYKWQEIAGFLPENLSGWEVLDIGCNEGLYSFELARRGARVTAVDMNARYLAQARWAAMQFHLQDNILFKKMQVYHLANCPKKFDLVLFLGVFYHLRYPLLALDIVSRLVGKLLVFQTLLMPGEEVITGVDPGMDERETLRRRGWPAMAFIENSLAGDRTNWWAANHAAAEAMLRSSGFRVTARPGREIYLCEPDTANPSCSVTWNSDEYQAAVGNSRCG
jgi:tRNA (mo5U34)-methyltransferase